MQKSFVSNALLLLPICTCILLCRVASAQNGLGRRGFRVPARRIVKKHEITKRHIGGGIATYNDGGWEVPILISGQELTMTISTGSADMWVASTLMPPSVQSAETTGKIFNPNTSPTYRTKDGYTFETSYTDGSSAQGPVGIDEVSIGEAVVLDMPFGTCQNWTFGSGVTSRDTTGQLGLAFRSLNSIKPHKQCTFMECLQPTLPEPIFSTSFKLSGSGFLDFGFVDDQAYMGETTTLSIANSTGYWMANDVRFGSSGRTFSSKATDTMFDSGTTSLSIPSSALSEYMSGVKGATFDNEINLWNYSCQSQLPDLELIFTHITSGPTTVIIPGENLKLNKQSPPGCYCLMSPMIAGYPAILGLPFLVDKYIIWNQSAPSLSIAKATGNGSTMPPPGVEQHRNGRNRTGLSTSLSTGDQAGIGVAVAILGIVLIAFAIWMFQRRKKRLPEAEGVISEKDQSGKPELEAQENEVPRYELHPEGVSELPSHGQISELTDDLKYELSGTRTPELGGTGIQEAPSDWQGNEAPVGASREVKRSWSFASNVLMYQQD